MKMVDYSNQIRSMELHRHHRHHPECHPWRVGYCQGAVDCFLQLLEEVDPEELVQAGNQDSLQKFLHQLCGTKNVKLGQTLNETSAGKVLQK